jgi:DNA-binding NtrC family response regulator
VSDKPAVDPTTGGTTTSAVAETPAPEGAVRSFVLTVLEGPAAGQSHTSTGDRCSIGSHPLNDLVIDDKTVSRFHCELRIEAGAVVLQDLQSRNRTILDGVVIREAEPRGGSLIRLGGSAVRFDHGARTNRLPLSDKTELGGLVGSSVPMRAAFAWLERAAKSEATVLLEGETGTGKGEAAFALHRAGGRAAKPFVVVDCTAIPANLLESELFGHEKGSFTGAQGRRVGAFEEADGGTIFLDEIGELPLDLQPKLLRVLENREIRRVGGSAKTVNVRVVAATNRDLRAEVNAGRFRSDLYFRLAVVKIALPPLRSRPEDLPLIVARILERLGAEPAQREAFLRPARIAELARSAWPGNVRELRNHLERTMVFPEDLEELIDEVLPATSPPPAEPSPAIDDVDLTVPFAEARDRALADFERRYLARILAAHDGKVTAAANAVGLSRVYVWKLLKKHRLIG